MKSHAELTKRQLQVPPYRLSCPTYEEAARQANVSVKEIYCWLNVPRIGLEPTRLAAPEPKSGMSTNFTIWAMGVILPFSRLLQKVYSTPS